MKKFYFLLLALGLFTSVNAQIVNIPDANFKAKLLSASSSNSIAKNLENSYFKIDANNDGEIQESEAFNVSSFDVSNSGIFDLTGIAGFTNLRGISAGFNQLSSLNVSQNPALAHLDCSNNQLINLNVTQNPNLGSLVCIGNQLLSLDLSQNPALVWLNCSHNPLTSLDLSQNLMLNVLMCVNNQLSSIDVSQNLALTKLACAYNQLTSLNVSQNIILEELNCSNNLLESIFIKDGNYIHWTLLYFDYNPNLRYICADEEDVHLVQQNINSYGYASTCHVNSYCSFTPNGTFYEIVGNAKLDFNTNGCDVSDINYPNLKYTITDGTTTGSFIATTTGNYYLPVQAGTHTISPTFENPTYFTVSPTSTTVTFPTQASPFTQDFCVTANGVHSDVEVSLIPVETARPGFDTKYKIVFKNKGNQVENATANLTFDDAKMDYVSSNPVFNSQATNQFTWNYANLQPFETRFIDVVFNINTPMESLPVNGGDVLSYTASITSANTDELPNDNSFTLNQTVVNSFDPNDITCLEGATVSTAKVGDYVHYMIRFENTGSANATNIVVKDVVDAAKFDVNSIVSINGSHDYYTRINGNNVEFIFENINLPFDDASNDGYVSFKIKTKATLVAGDTFSKNANIYFDYNFPITTNTSNTVIAALSTQDFEFKNYFRLYPNPVSNTLTIETKNAIQINSINIYNTLGQLVLVIPNAQETKAVDVSSLSAGNYFIKINSDKGSSNTKFIKQ